MQFKSAAIWLAAVCLVSATTASLAEGGKKDDQKKSGCKAACKSKCNGATCKTKANGATCKTKCSGAICEIDVVAAPACGTAKCIDLLGQLAGLDLEVEVAEVAEVCKCNDACKCGAACKCTAKNKCNPACKCGKAKKAKFVKIAKDLWGEKQVAAKKKCCAKASKCKKKGCCAKAVARKHKATPGKRIAITAAPIHRPAYPAVTPHPPVARPPHIPAPQYVAHAGPKTCPHHGTHAWHIHQQLVKIQAENARLKAVNQIHQQLIAQQKEHHHKMLEAQAQIMRLQAQVELASRREEIRDQLVDVTVQAAQAEWLLEIASESPEAFIKMVRGEEAKPCSIKGCDIASVKTENRILRAKVVQLEKQIQEIIKHTAKTHSHNKGASR